MLFTILSIYIFFMSITLPVIQYYKSKKVKNGYFQDVCIHYYLLLFIIKKNKKNFFLFNIYK